MLRTLFLEGHPNIYHHTQYRFYSHLIFMITLRPSITHIRGHNSIILLRRVESALSLINHTNHMANIFPFVFSWQTGKTISEHRRATPPPLMWSTALLTTCCASKNPSWTSTGTTHPRRSSTPPASPISSRPLAWLVRWVAPSYGLSVGLIQGL